MSIVEQLQAEAYERASSPAGMLTLLRLLLEEASNVDFSKENGHSQYVTLLKLYVRSKLVLSRVRQISEREFLDDYADVVRRLKLVIQEKRADARRYEQSLPPEDARKLKVIVGRRSGYITTGCALYKLNLQHQSPYFAR